MIKWHLFCTLFIAYNLSNPKCQIMTIPNFPKIITQLNNQNQNYEIIIPNPMNNYGTRGGREPQCP